MSNLAGIVKEIAVSTAAETVTVELICGDVLSAQVLHDDIKSGRELLLAVKVGARVESETN